MTEIILSETERLVVMHLAPGNRLLCHFELKNRHGNWQGRAWFHLTKETLDALTKELEQ
jgi:hypothetical protein